MLIDFVACVHVRIVVRAPVFRFATIGNRLWKDETSRDFKTKRQYEECLKRKIIDVMVTEKRQLGKREGTNYSSLHEKLYECLLWALSFKRYCKYNKRNRLLKCGNYWSIAFWNMALRIFYSSGFFHLPYTESVVGWHQWCFRVGPSFSMIAGSSYLIV